jgi:hypothetical protein
VTPFSGHAPFAEPGAPTWGNSCSPPRQIIGGIPATCYTGSYSIGAALRKLPAGLCRQSGPAVRSLGVPAVHFTVRIDGQHRTRQIVIVESGKGTTITSRLQISAINQPVHVTF